MNRVSTVLLAAGRSSRMGAFKPLLGWGNSTVIRTCISNFLDGGADEVIVVAGHRSADIRREIPGIDDRIRVVENPNPDSEMATSIGLGIAAISPLAAGVLVGLADQPAIPVSVISSLIETHKKTRALVVRPFHEGRGGHPVLIDLRLRDRLLHLDETAGLRSLLAEFRDSTAAVETDSEFIARDMDKWEDYVTLHNAVFGYEPGQPPRG